MEGSGRKMTLLSGTTSLASFDTASGRPRKVPRPAMVTLKPPFSLMPAAMRSASSSKGANTVTGIPRDAQSPAITWVELPPPHTHTRRPSPKISLFIIHLPDR